MDLMSSVVGEFARLTRLCLAPLLEPIRLEIVLVWAAPLPSTFFAVHWTSPNDSLPSFPGNQDFQLLTFYIGFLKCEHLHLLLFGGHLPMVIGPRPSFRHLVYLTTIQTGDLKMRVDQVHFCVYQLVLRSTEQACLRARQSGPFRDIIIPVKTHFPT